jgi:hypothetical protein
LARHIGCIDQVRLDRLLIVYPGDKTWPVSERIIVYPVHKVQEALG